MFFDTNGKLIRTNKSKLKSVESVYSNDILLDKPNDIKYMMKDLFEFSHEEYLFENLKKEGNKFETYFFPVDTRLFLMKIKENFPRNLSSEESWKIRKIYKEYLFKYSKAINKINEPLPRPFDGPFLDI